MPDVIHRYAIVSEQEKENFDLAKEVARALESVRDQGRYLNLREVRDSLIRVVRLHRTLPGNRKDLLEEVYYLRKVTQAI